MVVEGHLLYFFISLSLLYDKIFENDPMLSLCTYICLEKVNEIQLKVLDELFVNKFKMDCTSLDIISGGH